METQRKHTAKKKIKEKEKVAKARRIRHLRVTEIILPNYIHICDVMQSLPCSCTSRKNLWWSRGPYG